MGEDNHNLLSPGRLIFWCGGIGICERMDRMKECRREYMYEDDLPEDISDDMYDWWYFNSHIDNGIRVGPVIVTDKKEGIGG